MSNTVADNTVANLFAKHPTNKVLNGGNKTQSNKPWTQNYHPIHDLRVHTRLYRDGKTYADFETAFLAWEEDDNLRISAQAVDPNRRTWLFETEADCELWFHSEISNVILPAWSEFPLVTQSSHTKPSGNENISEEVDAVYSVASGARATVLAIGEMKRNLIRSSSWQDGNITKNVDQIKLSQELRGYADKYQCPHVFCFDGTTLLVLQFRANTVEEIRERGCPVDCWVLPRETSATPLRYALYMLLSQGFRRFQGMCETATPLTVGGMTPLLRQFYNGLPVWRGVNGGNVDRHPDGYHRSVDVESGAVKWTNAEDGEVVWETEALWGEHAGQ